MKRKSAKQRIPFRNQNHTGWWIASYLERFEWYDEDTTNPERRCLAWENTIIVQAANREQAYRKAMKVGRLEEGSEAWTEDGKRRGAWRFEGLTCLLPIYYKLEDGSEILWREHRGRTVRKIQELVKPKDELEVFDDSGE